MATHYRKHLILVRLAQDSDTAMWTARAHVEFTRKRDFHDVVIGPTGPFKSSSQAEKEIIRQAKEWIDSRLDKPE
jgi:hypothetical protein